MDSPTLPTVKDIEAAEEKVRKFFPPTPLEYSKGISDLLGREVYLKLETAIPIKVFKLRGALNKLQSLPEADLNKGIITASSGNHGFAIAYAAKLFGVRAVICVPENVNPQKLQAIEEQGAEVVKSGWGYDETYENALSAAAARGMTFVHAFNDKDVIAGQGTCGLEMSRQLPDMDAVVVAIGGGGLISGISIAVKSMVKDARVLGAETVSIPSMFESMRQGKRVHISPQRTIADGMQASIPGELTFEAAMKNVDRIGLVNDSQLEDAIFDLLSLGRVLAEPAGASPLAAMKEPLKDEPCRKVVLVVSGGNISVELLTSILTKRAQGKS